TNLGYSSAQASAALARIVAREGDGVPTEKLIRLGLRELSS
ncbi:MAG: Holliday junction branch migration protein RuvA, partial [Alphaproteobacteria bacterium]|nr:Holliday junction branch migration protein RuvA [Alphaproteobacteria bacterium]